MILNSLIVILIFFTSFFIIALIVKNNSVVDFAWGVGFLVVALFNMFNKEKIKAVDVIMFAMVALWAVRLAYYIFKRNFKKPEDFRYLKWRKEWGRFFIIRSFFQIFMLQGILQFTVSLPIILAYSSNNTNKPIFIYLGAVVFLTGFLLETIADEQMKNFKKKPENKGNIILAGLWKYSRHPNYFGEFVIWTGIFLFSFGMGADIIAIVSPVLMYLLLNYVSGVPMLEKKYANRADFEEYKKKTSVFFPWFPK